MTVLELMVVLVILSLIGVVATTQVMQQMDRAKVDVARLQLKQIENALEIFRLDVHRYPTGDEGLGALLSEPTTLAGWRGPYLKAQELLIDPWGAPIGYGSSGEGTFEIVSSGADRKPGGEGANADLLARNN